MEMWLVVSILAVLFHNQIAAAESNKIVYYVCSENNSEVCKEVSLYSSCCMPLMNYTYNSREYFTRNDTHFHFFSGEHHLNVVINVTRVTSFSLQGGNDTTILCDPNGMSGFNFEDVTNLTIFQLTFTSCSWTKKVYNSFQQVGLYLYFIDGLNLTETIVQNTSGYGIMTDRTFGIISNCIFQYCHGSLENYGGNAAISHIGCQENNNTFVQLHELNIINSSFLHGTAYHAKKGSFASGLTIWLKCSDTTLNIIDSTLIGNRVHLRLKDSEAYGISGGGNLAIIYYNETSVSNHIIISNTVFSNGQAVVGGAIYVRYFINSLYPEGNHTIPCNSLIISNSSFEKNLAYKDGGAVYIQFSQGLAQQSQCPETNFAVQNCTFKKNMVTSNEDAGLAIRIVNYYPNGTFIRFYTYYIINFVSCSFQDHFIVDNDTNRHIQIPGSAVLYISEQLGDTVLIDCTFRDNEATAIVSFRSQLTFEGTTTIDHNMAFSGGGMILCEASYMILKRNTTLIISNNHANQTGGGIFVEGKCNKGRPLCFYQIDYSDDNDAKQLGTSSVGLLDTINVELINNTADYAGTQLYGGTADECYLPNFSNDIFLKIFHVETEKNDYSNVTSDPFQVCFCENDIPDCFTRSKTLDPGLYSGEPFNLSLVTVGQYNGTAPGIIEVNKPYNHINLEAPVKKTEKTCKEINFTVCINEGDTETNILFKVQNQIPPLYLNVTVPIKPTPLGFSFRDNDHTHCSIDDYKCMHLPNIQREGFQCDIQQEHILRPPPYWLGYLPYPKQPDKKVFVLSNVCPLNYCYNKNINISTGNETFDQDAQCDYNRTGILCGKCEQGLSLSIGSSACLDCSGNTTLTVIAMSLLFATAGLLLVFILLACNLTVTEGTMSGLLFYANIFQVFSDTYIPPVDSPSKILMNFFEFVIGLLNLRVYSNTCFVDGMDTNIRTWLQFSLSVYLWALAGAIILLSRRYTWIVNRIGSKAVPVLATVFLLSYTTLNQGVIAAISFATLNYTINDENKTSIRRYVLLYDGNVEYLHGKHIPLFIAGVLFGTLSLTFTFTLLCIQPLQRYSHLKCLTWVSKLKPLIDAYTCPHILKPKCRFWNGFLLLIRVVLFMLYAINIRYNRQVNLFGIIVACVIVQTVAWSVGGVYTKWQFNVLTSSFAINIILLSATTAYFQSDKEVSHHHSQAAATFFSLTIAVLTFSGILCYHAYKQLSRIRSCRRLTRHRVSKWPSCCLWLRKCVRRNQYQRVLQHVVTISGSESGDAQDLEDSDLIRKDVADNFNESNEYYREPQLADADGGTV